MKGTPGGDCSSAISSPLSATHSRQAPASSQLISTPSACAAEKSTLRMAFWDASHLGAGRAEEVRGCNMWHAGQAGKTNTTPLQRFPPAPEAALHGRPLPHFNAAVLAAQRQQAAVAAEGHAFDGADAACGLLELPCRAERQGRQWVCCGAVRCHSSFLLPNVFGERLGHQLRDILPFAGGRLLPKSSSPARFCPAAPCDRVSCGGPPLELGCKSTRSRPPILMPHTSERPEGCMSRRYEASLPAGQRRQTTGGADSRAGELSGLALLHAQAHAASAGAADGSSK